MEGKCQGRVWGRGRSPLELIEQKSLITYNFHYAQNKSDFFFVKGYT